MYAQHLTRWEGAMRVSHLRDSASPGRGGQMTSVPRPSLTRQEELAQDGGTWWRVCGTRSTVHGPRVHGPGTPINTQDGDALLGFSQDINWMK